MTPGSLLCLCRLDGKESATAVPVNLDKNGVKIFRSRAERTKGEKRTRSIFQTWEIFGLSRTMTFEQFYAASCDEFNPLRFHYSGSC